MSIPNSRTKDNPLADEPSQVVETREARKVREAKRSFVYTLQNIAADILGPGHVIETCLRSRIGTVELVGDRYGRAKLHNLVTCKSKGCPICEAKRTAKDREWVERRAKIAHGLGYSIVFLTVTVRHYRGFELSKLLNGLLESWRGVFSGDRSGERVVLSRVKGQIKALETRAGFHGWHPHLHVLLFIDERDMTEADRAIYEDRLAELIYSRFERKVKGMGLDTVRDAFASRKIDLAGVVSKYVTKLESTLTLETVDGEGKDSQNDRHPSYSPFQLLALVERGTEEIYGMKIRELYREYCKAVKHRRVISPSRNLDKALGIDDQEDQEDQEDQDSGSGSVKIADVPDLAWSYIRSPKHDLRCTLLEIAERALREGDLSIAVNWIEGILDRALIESIPGWLQHCSTGG